MKGSDLECCWRSIDRKLLNEFDLEYEPAALLPAELLKFLGILSKIGLNPNSLAVSVA